MSEPSDPSQWFDHAYWGPNGPDISRWKHGCARGVPYHETGAPIDAGTPGQVRKISTGRKTHRGLASDDLERHQKTE